MLFDLIMEYFGLLLSHAWWWRCRRITVRLWARQCRCSSMSVMAKGRGANHNGSHTFQVRRADIWTWDTVQNVVEVNYIMFLQVNAWVSLLFFRCYVLFPDAYLLLVLRHVTDSKQMWHALLCSAHSRGASLTPFLVSSLRRKHYCGLKRAIVSKRHQHLPTVYFVELLPSDFLLVCSVLAWPFGLLTLFFFFFFRKHSLY